MNTTTKNQIDEQQNIARAHFEEDEAILLCLQKLKELNHSCVGFPANHFSPWTFDRFKKMQQLAKQTYPELEIIPHFQNKSDLIELYRIRKYIDTIKNLSRYNNARINDAIKFTLLLLKKNSKINKFSQIPHHGRENEGNVLASASEFFPLIANPKITAIIAPNDYMARRIHWFCNAFNISAPNDLGLISFDNLPDNVVGNLSTIDFGFGYLGYACFHYINKTSPVNINRKKEIKSKPEFMDRGSLGPADKVNVRRRIRNINTARIS